VEYIGAAMALCTVLVTLWAWLWLVTFARSADARSARVMAAQSRLWRARRRWMAAMQRDSEGSCTAHVPVDHR
jgi:hypothetical protein